MSFIKDFFCRNDANKETAEGSRVRSLDVESSIEGCVSEGGSNNPSPDLASVQIQEKVIKLLKKKDLDICEIKSLIDEDNRIVNCKDTYGNSVLHLAIAKVDQTKYEHIAFIDYLVEKGADLKAEIEGGYTPFLYAALRNKFTALEHLAASKDNDVNAQNKDGNTALHLAVLYDRTESVAILHKLSKTHNFQEGIVNQNGGMTALGLARSKNPANTTIIEILEDKHGHKHSMPRDTSYLMQSEPRGICLIIQNENFDPSESQDEKDSKCQLNRTGCQDAILLKRTFEKLKFKVETAEDLKGYDMYKLLKEYSKRDHTMYDCFVLCISSHGSGENVYGTDWKPVPVKNVITLFTGPQCKDLSGKPKLFFINSCRNKSDAAQQQMTKNKPRYKEDSRVESNEGENEIYRSLLADEVSSGHGKSKVFTNDIISIMEDIFEGHSTPEGFKSYREDTSPGTCVSIYIDELCRTLDEYGDKMEFQHIITMVNFRVRERGVHVPSPINRLLKQLWFF